MSRSGAGRVGRDRRLARMAVALALLAAAGLAVKHVLLDRARVPDRARFEIDLERVRALARQPEGSLPTAVNVVFVASARVPRAAVVAGAAFTPHELVRTAYQVVYPDGFVVVDTGLDRELHDAQAAGEPFHAADYRTLQKALARARGILVTHEHPDHLGGLARSPHLESILARVWLTRSQLADPEWLEQAGLPADVTARIRPLDPGPLYAAAPGIVLIAAPGHTPGTQLVYVQRADGAEYLFVGDIAWHMDNLRLGVGRPLWVARFVLGEDRDAVLDQLRALQDLAAREPALRLLVSHDGDQLADLIARGWIGPDFELPEDLSASAGRVR